MPSRMPSRAARALTLALLEPTTCHHFGGLHSTHSHPTRAPRHAAHLMLNVHDEPSLQKESTLLSPNTTPDGDEASPQKKAPLVKLNGTPERNESSYLKKAPPTKLHEKHVAKDKPGPPDHRLPSHHAQGPQALAPEGGDPQDQGHPNQGHFSVQVPRRLLRAGQRRRHGSCICGPSALYAPPRPGRALYPSPLPIPQADGTSAIHILSLPFTF